MTAAAVVFAALMWGRAAGFWGFLLRNTGSVDAVSVRLWLTHGLWPLLLAAAFWAAALGLGRRTLAAARVPSTDLPAAALGLALLGQAVFVLAWAGALRPGPLLALGLAALASARLPAVGRPGRLSPVEGAAAGALAFAAACAVLTALAPPTSWDVRAYHLALPELDLRAGAARELPWMLHSHWPHLMEELYALPLAAGRDGAAALIHLGAAALLVAGTFAAARRTAGRAAGWTAALLLAAQPALLSEAGTAHSDAAAALLAFAAAVLLARFEEEGGEGALAAAGLLAGAAAAAKLTLVAPLTAWTAWLALRRRPQDAGLFLGTAALMLAPWLIKTWLATGDPVWPFLSGVLGRGPAAALAARNAVSNRWGFPPPAWALTQDGPFFLLIPLAAFFALARPRARASGTERFLWLGAGPLLLLVVREHSAWRYLMPVWPALALAAGRAAAPSLEGGGARAALAAALAAAGAAPIALASPNNVLFAAVAPRPTSAPDADRRVLFEDRAVDVAGFYREARGVLPPGAKVLLFREIRGYGAGFDYLWGDPMNQALIDYRAAPDPDALAARLKELGVTHVLDHPGSTLYREDPGYYDGRTLALMAEALRRHAKPVLDGGGLALYQLL